MPILFFFLTALLHTMVLLLPLFFDFMIIPGYAGLFFLISLPLSMLAPRVGGLKRWHFLAFLPVLFLIERLVLMLLERLPGLIPATVLQTQEFVNGIAPTGIISSLGVYFFASMIAMISLLLQEKRSILYIHRIVDTEDEWNRVFAWLRDNDAAGDMSEFRWRLMQNRCFAFVAVVADRILASALLTPGKPGAVFISDFVFRENEIGLELLSGLLGRPELRKVKQIHFISRLPDGTPQNSEAMPETWLRQLYSEDCFQVVPADAMSELREFSPDGSALRPFALARPLFTFLPEAVLEAEAKNT